jgi:hypothetical protein
MKVGEWLILNRRYGEEFDIRQIELSRMRRIEVTSYGVSEPLWPSGLLGSGTIFSSSMGASICSR